MSMKVLVTFSNPHDLTRVSQQQQQQQQMENVAYCLGDVIQVPGRCSSSICPEIVTFTNMVCIGWNSLTPWNSKRIVWIRKCNLSLHQHHGVSLGKTLKMWNFNSEWPIPLNVFRKKRVFTAAILVFPLMLIRALFQSGHETHNAALCLLPQWKLCCLSTKRNINLIKCMNCTCICPW